MSHPRPLSRRGLLPPIPIGSRRLSGVVRAARVARIGIYSRRTLDHSSLNSALGRLADGDRTAFEQVFEGTWPLVLRFTQRALLSEADAEDAAQATLLKVFNRAYQYDKARDALPWVLTLAAFECKTIRQQWRRRKEDLAGETLTDIAGDDGGDQTCIERDLRARLDGIIAELKASDREVILAVLNDGERPFVRSATFRKRLQRALTRVKAVWSAQYADES